MGLDSSEAFEAVAGDAPSRAEGGAQVAATTAGLHQGEIANIRFASGTTGLPKSVGWLAGCACVHVPAHPGSGSDS